MERRSMLKHLPNALIVLGSALLIFGLLGFKPARSGTDVLDGPYSTGVSYPLGSKVVAALGATALATGMIIRRRPTSAA